MGSQNDWWLPPALAATTQAIPLTRATRWRSALRELMPKLDEETTSCLAHGLPVAEPPVVACLVGKAGGVNVLSTEAAHDEIRTWCASHTASHVLHELSKAVTGLVALHRRSELIDGVAVLQALPVLAMSAFVEEGSGLKRDLAVILGADTDDVPAMIRGYRRAAEAGDSRVVEAVDECIRGTPVWGRWVSTFIKEASVLAEPQRTATEWVFPGNGPSEGNGSSVRHWLFRQRQNL